MNIWTAVRKAVVVGSCCLLGVLAVGMVFERNAGWPHDLSDLQGRWVLDHVRGEVDEPVPETLWFSGGSTKESVCVSDGRRTAEFVLPGSGRMVFPAGHQFEPLLPAGASSVHTMTHLCPPVPAWDHLAFFLDGSPSPMGRVVVYERE